MGKRMNYFDYAENDYFFYRANYEEHRIGNAMCSSAQGICERYLKHLVDIYCTDEDTTSVLRAHPCGCLKSTSAKKWKILNVTGILYLAQTVSIFQQDIRETNPFLLMRRTLRFAGKRWRRFASV